MDYEEMVAFLEKESRAVRGSEEKAPSAFQFQVQLHLNQALIREIQDPCSLEYAAEFELADRGLVSFGKPEDQCGGDLSTDDLEAAFSLLKDSEGSSKLNAAGYLNLGCAYVWLFRDVKEAERLWKAGISKAKDGEEASEMMARNIKRIIKPPDISYLISNRKFLEAARQLTNDPGPRIHLIPWE